VSHKWDIGLSPKAQEGYDMREMDVVGAINNLRRVRALGELFFEYGGTPLEDPPFSMETLCATGAMLMELAENSIEMLEGLEGEPLQPNPFPCRGLPDDERPDCKPCAGDCYIPGH